jgi:hypothetical protein
MFRNASSSGGYNRYIHIRGDESVQCQLITFLGTICINGVETDFPST